jgi:hypothetical protein
MTTLPGDLIASLRNREVQLFVGSGVSAGAGLLGWDELIQHMKQTIKAESKAFTSVEIDNFFKSADHLNVAELFKQTVGSHAYFRFLRSAYRRDVPLTKSLKALARFPANTVYTTNYDKLLESAFRAKGIADPAVVVYPGQLNYIESKELKIVKIHGDIDHPDTIVLTSSDYAAYQDRHLDFVDLLHSSINGATMLFVGFGLRDPNFQRIYSDARTLYDSAKRQAYALMVGTNAVDRHFWHEAGLTILPILQHNRLPGVLGQIVEAR